MNVTMRASTVVPSANRAPVCSRQVRAAAEPRKAAPLLLQKGAALAAAFALLVRRLSSS